MVSWTRRPPLLLMLLACAAALAAGCASGRPARRDMTLIITEVLFQPSAAQGTLELIELTNLGAAPMDASGWQVTGAGRVALPAGVRLEPGDPVVLVSDAALYAKTFPGSRKPVATLTGKLRNTGETLRVEDPSGLVADEAEYLASDPEVKKAAGTGLSIHRVARYPGGGASSIWRAGPPTPGVPKKAASGASAPAP